MSKTKNNQDRIYYDKIQLRGFPIRILDKNTGRAEVTYHVMPEDRDYVFEVGPTRKEAGAFVFGFPGIFDRARVWLATLRTRAVIDGQRIESGRLRGGKHPKHREAIYQFVKECLQSNPKATYGDILQQFAAPEEPDSIQVEKLDYDVYRDGEDLVQVCRTRGPKENQTKYIKPATLEKYVVRARKEKKK